MYKNVTMEMSKVVLFVWQFYLNERYFYKNTMIQKVIY